MPRALGYPNPRNAAPLVRGGVRETWGGRWLGTVQRTSAGQGKVREAGVSRQGRGELLGVDITRGHGWGETINQSGGQRGEAERVGGEWGQAGQAGQAGTEGQAGGGSSSSGER